MLFHSPEKATDYDFGFVFYYPVRGGGTGNWMLGGQGFMGQLSRLIESQVERTTTMLQKQLQFGKGNLHRSQINFEGQEFFLACATITAVELNPDLKGYRDLFKEEGGDSGTLAELDPPDFESTPGPRQSLPNNSFLKRMESLRRSFQPQKKQKSQKVEFIRDSGLEKKDFLKVIRQFGYGLEGLFEKSQISKGGNQLKDPEERTCNFKEQTFREMNENSLSQIDLDQEILKIYSNQTSFVGEKTRDVRGFGLSSERRASPRPTNKILTIKLSFASKQTIEEEYQENADQPIGPFLKTLSTKTKPKAVYERKLHLFEINETHNEEKPFLLGDRVLERVKFSSRKEGFRAFVDRVAASKRGEIREPGYREDLLKQQLRRLFGERVHTSFVIGVDARAKRHEILNLVAFAGRVKQMDQNVRILSLYEIEKSQSVNMFDSMLQQSLQETRDLSDTREVNHESIWIERLRDDQHPAPLLAKNDENVDFCNIFNVSLGNPHEMLDTSEKKKIFSKKADRLAIRKEMEEPLKREGDSESEVRENVTKMDGLRSPRFSQFFNKKRQEIHKAIDLGESRDLSSSLAFQGTYSERKIRKSFKLDGLPNLDLLKEKIERIVRENNKLKALIQVLEMEKKVAEENIERFESQQQEAIDRVIKMKESLTRNFQNILRNSNQECQNCQKKEELIRSCELFQENLSESLTFLQRSRSSLVQHKLSNLTKDPLNFEIGKTLDFEYSIWSQMPSFPNRLKKHSLKSKIKNLILKYSTEDLSAKSKSDCGSLANVTSNVFSREGDGKVSAESPEGKLNFDEAYKKKPVQSIIIEENGRCFDSGLQFPKNTNEMKTSIFKDEFLVQANKKYDQIWDSLIDFKPKNIVYKPFDSRVEFCANKSSLSLENQNPFVYQQSPKKEIFFQEMEKTKILEDLNNTLIKNVTQTESKSNYKKNKLFFLNYLKTLKIKIQSNPNGNMLKIKINSGTGETKTSIPFSSGKPS